MARRSHPDWQPPQKLGRRRGATGWDPFYQFEQIARNSGEPPRPARPSKGKLLLVELLTSKAAAVVMGCVLAFAVLVLLVLMVFRA